MEHKRGYIPLTQQRFCCVPACIQMILLRRNLPVFSQEKIGHDLGLIVPKKFKKILPEARTGKKPSRGWGTQVDKKGYSINDFFRNNIIPLKEENFHVSEIKNVISWIKEQIRKDNDIIVCFNYGKLYGNKRKYHGHVSILDSISNTEATLIEPGYNLPKYRKVKLKELLEAMKFHEAKAEAFAVSTCSRSAGKYSAHEWNNVDEEKNLGGFWLISSK